MFDQTFEGVIGRRLPLALLAGAAVAAGVALWMSVRVAFGTGGPHVELTARSPFLAPVRGDGAGLAQAIDRSFGISCADDLPFPLRSVATDNDLVVLRIAAGSGLDVVARLGNHAVETIACDGRVHPLGLTIPEGGPELSMPHRFRLIEMPRVPAGDGPDGDAATRDALQRLDRSGRLKLREIGKVSGFLVAPLKSRNDQMIGDRWLGASVRGYLLVEG